MKKLKSSVVISIAAFFAIFFIFSGFAIDFTFVLVARSQLQTAVETAALSSLDEYEETEIAKRARKIFNYSKVGGIKYAEITSLQVKTNPRAVMVTATAPVKTYFLSALGISRVDVQARAAATVESKSPEPFASARMPVPSNHKQYKLDKPFLARGREIFIKGMSPELAYRVFVALGSENPEDVRWVEVTCSASPGSTNNTGIWYSLDDTCNGSGALGAAQYIRLSLQTQSPPNFYWDWDKTGFSIEDFSVITSVKLIRASMFNSL